jgi:hypothetical protein
VSWLEFDEKRHETTEYLASFDIHGLITIQETYGMRIRLPEKDSSYN